MKTRTLICVLITALILGVGCSKEDEKCGCLAINEIKSFVGW